MGCNVFPSDFNACMVGTGFPEASTILMEDAYSDCLKRFSSKCADGYDYNINEVPYNPRSKELLKNYTEDDERQGKRQKLSPKKVASVLL